MFVGTEAMLYLQGYPRQAADIPQNNRAMMPMPVGSIAQIDAKPHELGGVGPYGYLGN